MTQNKTDLTQDMITQLQQALSKGKDFLGPMIQATLKELLEEETSLAQGASKSERSPGRLGYRSGHYPRTLVTRVGKIELMVPQDRDGRFSTALGPLSMALKTCSQDLLCNGPSLQRLHLGNSSR